MLLNPSSSDSVLTNVHGFTLLKKFFSAVIVEVKCKGGDICNLGVLPAKNCSPQTLPIVIARSAGHSWA